MKNKIHWALAAVMINSIAIGISIGGILSHSDPIIYIMFITICVVVIYTTWDSLIQDYKNEKSKGIPPSQYPPPTDR